MPRNSGGLVLIAIAGALCEDPGVGLVPSLGEREQCVGTEAGPLLPLFAVALGSRDGDVVHRTVAGLILPDDSLDAAVTDDMAGLVAGSVACRSAVHFVSSLLLGHRNLLTWPSQHSGYPQRV